LSIIVRRNACRAGMSNALTTPWTTLRTTIHSRVIRPDSTSAASANDCSIEIVCVTTSRRWRSQRSTKMPANGPSTNAGNWPAKLTTPSRKAEPVRR
jgi:hypothetical protein